MVPLQALLHTQPPAAPAHPLYSRALRSSGSKHIRPLRPLRPACAYQELVGTEEEACILERLGGAKKCLSQAEQAGFGTHLWDLFRGLSHGVLLGQARESARPDKPSLDPVSYLTMGRGSPAVGGGDVQDGLSPPKAREG